MTGRGPHLPIRCLEAAPARRRRGSPSQLVVTLLLLSNALCAEEDADAAWLKDFQGGLSEDTVKIRNTNIKPAGNMSYHADALKIHPKAMAGVSYTSNLYATSADNIDDAIIDTLAGIDARYAIDPTQHLGLDTLVVSNIYADQRRRNSLGGSISGQYDLQQSNGIAYQASGGYTRTDDPLPEADRNIDREATSAGLQARYNGWASRLRGRIDYLRENYFEDDPLFTAKERNASSYRLSALYAYRSGADSEIRARISADTRDFEVDGRFQDSNGLASFAGWRTFPTSKTSIDIEAGYQALWFRNDFNHDPRYGDRNVGAPVGSITARWDPEYLSYCTWVLFTSLGYSLYSNAVTVYGTEFNVHYRVRVNATMIASVRGYLYDQSGSIPGSRDRSHALYSQGGFEYLLRDGLIGRILVGYDNGKSSSGNDYERATARLEIAVAY
jgi:hypothetical protein